MIFFFSFSTQFISLKLVNESSDLFGQTSNGQLVLIRLRDGRELRQRVVVAHVLETHQTDLLPIEETCLGYFRTVCLD